jgi:hypothetical protein
MNNVFRGSSQSALANVRITSSCYARFRLRASNSLFTDTNAMLSEEPTASLNKQ